jgi:hypothetical protein
MEFVMGSNVRQGAAGVLRHSDNETSVARTDHAATVRVVDPKGGGEAPQAPKPWPPADFGWDFPFDSPKPAR